MKGRSLRSCLWEGNNVPKKIDILGVKVDPVTMDEAVAQVETYMDEMSGVLVATAVLADPLRHPVTAVRAAGSRYLRPHQLRTAIGWLNGHDTRADDRSLADLPIADRVAEFTFDLPLAPAARFTLADLAGHDRIGPRELRAALRLRQGEQLRAAS